MNDGKVTSVILTDKEIAALCKKVNLEVENIIHQHRELLITGAIFLDSIQIRLSIESGLNSKAQMRTFMAKPIQEILNSDENKGVKLVVNGLSDSDLIIELVRESQPLNMTYAQLLNETLIEYSYARDILALLFRKQVIREYLPHQTKKNYKK